MYCGTGSLGRSTPALWVKPLVLSYITNIFAVNILLKRAKSKTFISFCKLIISDIKVKILINSSIFDSYFGFVLLLIDTLSFQ